MLSNLKEEEEEGGEIVRCKYRRKIKATKTG